MRHEISHTAIRQRMSEMQEELIKFTRTMRVLMREHARVNISPDTIASIDDIVTVLTSIQKTRKRHRNTEFNFHADSDNAQFHGSFDNFPLGHLEWGWRHTGEHPSESPLNRRTGSIRVLVRLGHEPVLYSYRYLTKPEVNKTWARVPNQWTNTQYERFIEVLGKPTLSGWNPGAIENLDIPEAFKLYRRKAGEFTALERTRFDKRTHPLKTKAEERTEQKTDHADVVDLSPPRTENCNDKAVASS